MNIGQLEVTPIYDGTASVPAHQYLTYGGRLADPWADHQDLLAADGHLQMDMGGYLVRTDGRVVLIDAGIGTINNDLFTGGELIRSLAAHGVQPDDVTDVLFTHLHFDHVGWATQRGAIVFEHATYRCHAADWDHFVGGPHADPGAVGKLGPISDQLDTFDRDQQLAPGIDVRHAPGHTPGSVIVVVSSGQQRAVLLGDIVHCPIELIDDEWSAIYDVDPELAQPTRTAVARELEGDDALVGAAHFPGLRFGRLLPGTGRRHWVFA